MDPMSCYVRPRRERKPEPIEKQRLLSIKEVAAYLGVCYVTASKIMRESGKAMRIGNRIMIQERHLAQYLKGLEGRL